MAGNGESGSTQVWHIFAGRSQTFLAGKIQAAQYFIRWELPEIEHHAKLLDASG